eukprot:gene22849-26905_t
MRRICGIVCHDWVCAVLRASPPAYDTAAAGAAARSSDQRAIAGRSALPRESALSRGEHASGAVTQRVADDLSPEERVAWFARQVAIAAGPLPPEAMSSPSPPLPPANLAAVL